MVSRHSPPFAPHAQTTHRGSALACNRAGAELWPASRSTRTRCPIDANRPPVCPRILLATLRPARPLDCHLPEPIRLQVPRQRLHRPFPGRALHQRSPMPTPLRLPPIRPSSEKSSWSASSLIQNMRECAPQPFTCPRNGTSRARSSGTTTGSSTPSPIPLMPRIPTTPRPISNTRSCGWSPPKLRRNSGNTTKAANSRPVRACPPAHSPVPRKPPLQALAMFIQKTRPNVTNLKWIGQQDLPGPGKGPEAGPLAQPARRCHQDRLRPERPTRRRGLLWRLLHLPRGQRGSERGHDQADQLGISGSAKHARTRRHARQAHADVLRDCQVHVRKSGMGPALQGHQRQDAGRLQPEAAARLRSNPCGSSDHGTDHEAAGRLSRRTSTNRKRPSAPAAASTTVFCGMAARAALPTIGTM